MLLSKCKPIPASGAAARPSVKIHALPAPVAEWKQHAKRVAATGLLSASILLSGVFADRQRMIVLRSTQCYM